MVDQLIIAVLAWAHILSAMFWLGGDAFLLMIFRRFDTMSPPSQGEVILKVYPLLIRWLRTVSSTTILFGLFLALAFSNGDLSYFSTTFGSVIVVGGTLGLVAYITGVLFAIPYFWKVSAIVKKMRDNPSQPPPPELQRYKHVSRVATVLTFALLLTAAILMIASGFYPL